MPRVKAIMNNFTAGEMTPYLSGRVDLGKYFSGCRTLENFIVLPWGGATRRWGSRYVTEVKSSTKKTRLIPFEFSTEQAYILEFGHQYIRFYKDHGQIISGAAAYEISSPYDEDDLAGIKFTQSADILYLVHPDYAPRKLSRTGHTSWTLSTIAFTDGPYLEERTDITITPSATSGNITLTASAALFLAGHVGAYFRIKHTGGVSVLNNSGTPNDVANWVLTECTLAQVNLAGGGYGGDAYYYSITENGATGAQTASRVLSGLVVGQNYRVVIRIKNSTGSWAGGVLRVMDNGLSATLATRVLESATDWTEYDLIFTATQENNQIRIDTALGVGTGEVVFWDAIVVEQSPASGTETWGYVQITAVTNSTTASATVKSNLGGTGASTAMREGAWSTYRKYPSCVSFFEQRLMFAGVQTIWGSKSADFENFTPGVLDDDPLTFAIVANQVNAATWMQPGDALMIGTTGGIFRMTGGSQDYLSPTNVDCKRKIGRRAADLDAVQVDSVILFVQKAGKKVHELVYDFGSDRFVAPDLTRLSSHATAGVIKEWCYQEEPYSMLWACDNAGGLLSMTYLRDEDVIAWARHLVDGEVESIASIPNPDGDADEVWMIVKRTINGIAKRYVEYLDPDLQTDCALTYSGAATATVTGLAHLAGETVDIIAAGAVYPAQVVPISGTMTIPKACAAIEVGLHYTSTLSPMRPELGIGGTSQGKPKKWSTCGVRVYASMGCKINDYQIPFRRESDTMGAAILPFTGDISVSELGWSQDGWVNIIQDQPLPCTILAFFGDLEVGG